MHQRRRRSAQGARGARARRPQSRHEPAHVRDRELLRGPELRQHAGAHDRPSRLHLRAEAALEDLQRSPRRRGGGAVIARAAAPRAGGFTLTELAIVMMIVALLAGGLLMTFAAQTESRQLTDPQRTLARARDAPMALAVA